MKAIVLIGSIGVASCVNLEREPLLSWKPTQKASAYPMDYFVPHFGQDTDIKSSFSHMATAESKLGSWTPKQDKKDDGAVWKDHWILPKPDTNFELVPSDADYRQKIFNEYPNCYLNARGC